MNKLYVEVIDDCVECPHLNSKPVDGKYQTVCCHPASGEAVVDLTRDEKFPYWCPLEDADDSSST